MKVKEVFRLNEAMRRECVGAMSKALMDDLLTAAHEQEFSELLLKIRGKGFVTNDELRILRMHHSWTTGNMVDATDDILDMLVQERFELRIGS